MRKARHFTPHPPGARKLLLELKRWALGDPRPHSGSDQVYAVGE